MLRLFIESDEEFYCYLEKHVCMVRQLTIACIYESKVNVHVVITQDYLQGNKELGQGLNKLCNKYVSKVLTP